MSSKQALRDLQTRLAERMQQVRGEPAGQSWLAVDCAGQGLLVALHQAGEIFDLGQVVPVPHTRPWLAGVVNLRGGVCTVVDLAAFLGLRGQAVVPATGGAARLVAFNAALGLNCALLVDRLIGLRSVGAFTASGDAPAGSPAYFGHGYTDAEGRHWQEINLQALSRDPLFLSIGS